MQECCARNVMTKAFLGYMVRKLSVSRNFAFFTFLYRSNCGESVVHLHDTFIMCLIRAIENVNLTLKLTIRHGIGRLTAQRKMIGNYYYRDKLRHCKSVVMVSLRVLRTSVIIKRWREDWLSDYYALYWRWCDRSSVRIGKR